MVNILIMKTLFKINILTYLFLILSFLAGYFREMIIVYVILFVHEFGHFFLMKYYKIHVNSITMFPYGGMIKSTMLINTNSMKVLIISLGGVLSQLLLWIIIYIFYKLSIINCYYYDIFFKYNLYLILFNLIPLYPLDGFKILNSILELFISFKSSIIISLIINLVFLIIFFVYLYINRISNYIIIIFLLFSLIKYFKDLKYLIHKFYIERIIYNIKFDGLRSVYDYNKMYKNDYNYIGIVGEKEYLFNRFGNF